MQNVNHYLDRMNNNPRLSAEGVNALPLNCVDSPTAPSVVLTFNYALDRSSDSVIAFNARLVWPINTYDTLNHYSRALHLLLTDGAAELLPPMDNTFTFDA